MWRRFRVMNQADADGGGAGGGSEGAGSGDSGAAAAAEAAGAAQGGAAESGGAASSLLKQGEAAAGAAPLPAEFIPEKFQVKAEDGQLDMEASARKLAEAHGHLEKRLGAGDLPPKTADEYKITPPEALKDAFSAESPQLKAFVADAHKLGLTQTQLDGVMQHYFEAVPGLAAGAVQLDQKQATEALQKVWGADEREFGRQAGLAHTAAAAAAQRAKIDMQEIETSGLGNHPVFLRLMAALGPEFQEDKGAADVQFSHVGEADIRKLETSEAYSNPRHPDHEKVSQQVRQWYERKHGTAPVA